MKKIILLTASALLIGLSAHSALAADAKIGTVDLAKVFDKYYKTARSTEALKKEATDMQKERKDMIDAARAQEDQWKKLVDLSEDQAASASERGKNKKAAEDKIREVKAAEQTIQEYDRASTTKLQEKKRQRSDDIVKEIRGVLDAEAKSSGYTMIIDTSGQSINMVPVILYSNGSSDLTDRLIKELNAGAPAEPAADKTNP